jgi:Mrp family chromosome partitioning ATPase
LSIFYRSPHYDIKVISVAALLSSKENAVIYKGPRKTHLIKRILKETFWGKLDYLICDTPPGKILMPVSVALEAYFSMNTFFSGTSDEHLTIIKLLKHIQPDGGVIISTPQKLSIDAVRKEISFCKKLNLNIIGLVENMSSFVCPCCEVSLQALYENVNDIL